MGRMLGLPDCAAVFEALAVPPRLVVRALDDLHTLAEGIRRLTDRDGDLEALLESVKVLPRTEDELSANIAALREDLKALQAWLEPLHQELTDLDETAEALERSMSSLQALLKKLPGV
jgi:chromosome segregation ATPase